MTDETRKTTTASGTGTGQASAASGTGLEPLLRIEDLDITFATDGGDVHAVNDLSLQVAPGEVLAIVGESGSGKTVTAKSILRLLPETATVGGAIVVSGDNVVTASRKQLRELRGKSASMVFQEPSTALNPVFTVGWQIAEGLRVHNPKMNRKELRARVVEAMEKVGIPNASERYDYYPHQFSGGQKQRIVIAMALALGAKLIIADEPTTALDVTVQAEILDLLRDLRDEMDTAIVLITHNMGVVADLADRVAVMYRGDLVETADVQTLFADPREEYTRNLLAAVPRLTSVSEREAGGLDAEAGAGEATGASGAGSARVTTTSSSGAAGTDAASEAATGAEAGRTRPDAAPIVVARNLEIVYPGGIGKPDFTAVDGVSFEIRPGEVFGMVGESGSGKTTIGRAIAGLTKATGGSLTVFGHEMVGFKERKFKPLRKRIGFVFQDPAASFNPHLSIGECVAEPIAVHQPDMSAHDRRQRTRELLEAVQLPEAYAQRYPHELSGGQRQRASLARGIALNPELLIADEPTSALDVSVQARVLELFAELQERFHYAALFISHDLAVVDMLSDRIGVLFHGRLLEEGTGAQVLGSPQHDYTRKLIASLPVPDPVEQAKRRELAREIRARV
ncbi:dipeptide ABC transporter ATP-binding protein [Brevibacterium luteolum]|uniref:dipeptide ABC transporter ATP-binding protein n=1 Tax=Brevibacterium luteolum TaxID=199591 RepID=UPI00223B5C06|nr:ABC transporter ATP-binding protein [Brevibacterium luteolum]MCT1872635.1 ABC transporter ATP-binding protein [Brevibacterium luteolum]MCT1889869.1 ABC transporter ATP-binding protein [Brevibacterium luteolum]MCT1892474.1 ABC transporter ATP-binding protein [Brevibacterium luteolum]MCT1924757.1 ABC transporter ATP-binding protein [Brevibacterium luteolum]